MTTTTSIADTIQNAFNFSVDKYRLSGPDNMKTDHFGLFRSDNLECVGNAVRKGYEPHTTDDIIALAEAAASAFDSEATIHCNWRDGHYVSVAPSKEHRRAIYGEKDNIFPRLIIRAGYDGQAFNACLGFYRDACRNLAMLRSITSTCAKIRHTHSLRGNMDDLKNTFAHLAASWDGTVQSIQRMEETKVDIKDFLLSIYPVNSEASESAQTRAQNRMEKLITRLLREKEVTGRPRSNQSSVWELYNCIQGYVQHDKSRKGRIGEFDRAILAFNDQDVKKAEELALSLAI